VSMLAPHTSDKVTTPVASADLSVARAVLMVTGGELSGARMYLDIGHGYSVGADEVCDIVLRGATVDGSSMQITLRPDGIGVCRSNQNESFDVAYQDELVFGLAKFFIVQTDEPANLPLDASAKPIHADLFHSLEDVTPANAAAVDIFTPVPEELAANRASTGVRRLLRPVLYAVVVVALGLIVVAAALWQRGSFSQPVVKTIPMESLLADAGFGHLEIDRSTSMTFISGYVQSRQQALSLAKVIATQSEPVLNRVQVDAEIKDQIENVMRVNGVVGLVESSGNGAFIANTQLPLGNKLDSLQGLIESDVPSVASFSINNQLPELPLESTNDSVQLDSGKRVVLVNSEKPSYIVTTDQSRYFVGSILPGGYRITDITNGRVLLEKQGKTTELKF